MSILYFVAVCGYVFEDRKEDIVGERGDVWGCSCRCPFLSTGGGPIGHSFTIGLVYAAHLAGWIRGYTDRYCVYFYAAMRGQGEKNKSSCW